MVFNSLSFAIFLPVVFIIYWLLPHKFRWVLLFAASYYFYMSWNAKYVVLILFTTAVTYFAARLLEKSDSTKKKKTICAVSSVLCLAVLFFFKYFNFFSGAVTDFLGLFSLKPSRVTLNLLLPVGISFYTFQTLSYVIDVYRGKVKAERHFGIYATFISFFPQLVAGPIERTDNLLPQIKNPKLFNYEQATYGMKLMAWGFFKKLAVADVLAQYVDSVFSSVRDYKGFDLVLAVLFFTVQIYCDFSGYSDIAIGSAKLMGIDLMTNFKSPYFSSSVHEFWSRWHISLSTWFRDYVYIPLGGNRCSKPRHYLNLVITFLVSGLWHGANRTYIIWGAIHGIAQCIEKLCNRVLAPVRKNRVGKIFATVAVFIFCNLAWVFFRAESLSDAFYVITHIFSGLGSPSAYFRLTLGFTKLELLCIVATLIILFFYDFFSLKRDLIQKLSKTKLVIRWIIYLVIIWLILVNMPPVNTSEFIYFQF